MKHKRRLNWFYLGILLVGISAQMSALSATFYAEGFWISEMIEDQQLRRGSNYFRASVSNQCWQIESGAGPDNRAICGSDGKYLYQFFVNANRVGHAARYRGFAPLPNALDRLHISLFYTFASAPYLAALVTNQVVSLELQGEGHAKWVAAAIQTNLTTGLPNRLETNYQIPGMDPPALKRNILEASDWINFQGIQIPKATKASYAVSLMGTKPYHTITICTTNVGRLPEGVKFRPKLDGTFSMKDMTLEVDGMPIPVMRGGVEDWLNFEELYQEFLRRLNEKHKESRQSTNQIQF